MEKMNYADYVSVIDKLKQQHKRTETNNFVLADKFKELLEVGNCWGIATSGCVFVAVPRHDTFYQLYYHAVGSDDIAEGLHLIDEQYGEELPLSCTVIGKERYVEEIVPVFLNAGYKLRKKIRRYNIVYVQKAKTWETTARFACNEDAEEIFELLTNNFDIYSEQIPSVDEIRQNAEKEQIVVVRCDNKIATLSYFEIHNKTLHRIFDYTRPEYRKSLIYLGIEPFLERVFEEKNIKINRSYGWRDMENKKLNRISEMFNNIAEDVVLYTVKKSYDR